MIGAYYVNKTITSAASPAVCFWKLSSDCMEVDHESAALVHPSAERKSSCDGDRTGFIPE